MLHQSRCDGQAQCGTVPPQGLQKPQPQPQVAKLPWAAGATPGAIPAAARRSFFCAAASGTEAGARCEPRSSGVQYECITAGLLCTLCLFDSATARA